MPANTPLFLFSLLYFVAVLSPAQLQNRRIHRFIDNGLADLQATLEEKVTKPAEEKAKELERQQR